MIGINMKSLETVSTIRREYPEIEVIVVDENKKSWIENKFGGEIFRALVE